MLELITLCYTQPSAASSSLDYHADTSLLDKGASHVNSVSKSRAGALVPLSRTSLAWLHKAVLCHHLGNIRGRELSLVFMADSPPKRLRNNSTILTRIVVSQEPSSLIKVRSPVRRESLSLEFN